MSIRRVALIYDDRARPDTTGSYCRRALGRFVNVEHYLPTELGRIPRDGFDLYLNVDDGLRYRLPAVLRPAAFWAIDTHLDFDWYRVKAPDFDFVFAAQRDGAEQLRCAGLSAHWLPLACDPEIHRRHDVAKTCDVAFVGNLFPGPRTELIGLLRRRFPSNFVGNRYLEEMAETYSSARLVFNRSLRGDVNMRVFEATACGTLLLTDDTQANGLGELFRPGEHLEVYRDADELLDKVAYYLRSEKVRKRISAAGMAEAHARHTYQHRLEDLLAHVERSLSAASVAPSVVLPTLAEPSLYSRDASYFEHVRPELLELIPRSARSVLDIGCGAGRLGAALKDRQPATVVGIELHPEVARRAERNLGRVLVGDVERLEPDFSPGSFDAVVCGDILEHLREPGVLLRRIHAWLRPGGRLVASVPNVRHHSVVSALLGGNWTYESAGLLDRDHLRFFTRREVEKLLFRAGFTIQAVHAVPGPGDEAWDRQGRPDAVRVGRLHVGGLGPEEAEEFYAYQYLLAAEPHERPDRGLTSIVLVTRDQLAYTRECLDSIRRLTDEPHELIVVDNGSTDGTVDFLRTQPGVRLIANAENRGFPAAANQGITVAAGRQVLLLNNDTIVTTGWLHRLLNALDSDPEIGLIGPCSNYAASAQEIPVSYDDLMGLDGFAWDWGKAHDRQLEDTDRLIGFCLLVRRAVFDRIGALDEQFGIGCFEDDDLCLRAIRAGYRAVIARDAFVHHYGGRTFVGSGVDFAAIMSENRQKFREKWAEKASASQAPEELPSGNEPIVALPSPQPEPRPNPLAIANVPGGGLLLVRDHIHLSLCMIVLDNARTIRTCLESIRPWVDEMVVIDTGSADETPAIVREYGARLFRFPWCDDFAAARNESLRHARGAWLFWMDSDDTIEPDCGHRLRRLAYGAHDPAVLGYVVQVHCPGPGADGAHDVTAVDHVKLIRNHPALRFEGRIHEQILPAIRHAGGEVAWTDLFVVHSGSDQTPEGRARKLERDFRLLELERCERPEHPFTLFNLGMTYADCSRHEEAVEHLSRSIRHAGPGESHLRKAYALLAYGQMQLGRSDEAHATLREARALFPEDAELRFREGVLLHELGRLEEAAGAYLAVLGHAEERHFSSRDRGITGFKARQNLALVLSELGDLPAAEAQWRRIVEEVPRYRVGWRGLGDILLRRSRVDAARELVEQLGREPGLEAEARLLAGRVAAAVGDTAAARRSYEAAIAACPDDPDFHHALCQLLFEGGEPAEAEAALRALIQHRPDDAAAHHNLGTLCLRRRRLDEAIDAYRMSLRHRPAHAATLVQLGYALEEGGRLAEAATAWQEVTRLEPGNVIARAELERVGGRPDGEGG